MRHLPAIMSFALAPGLSFCEAAGRRIFLDLNRDRYFCLSADADAAFDQLVSGADPSEEDVERLKGLARTGVLIDGPYGEYPRPCRSPPMSSSPLDTDLTTKPSMVLVLRAVWAIQHAKFALRVEPLTTVCERVASAKRRLRTELKPDGHEQLAGIAATFAAAGRMVATLNHCLPVAVAMTQFCTKKRIAAQLCIGIKLQPFEAHAWVVADDIVVSDRLETVRSFTPVLIL